MQNSPTAYAIGMCQGSSPNMCTKVIDNLAQELDIGEEVKVEGSWQLLEASDKGSAAIKSMWKEATTQADEQKPKEHLRIVSKIDTHPQDLLYMYLT